MAAVAPNSGDSSSTLGSRCRAGWLPRGKPASVLPLGEPPPATAPAPAPDGDETADTAPGDLPLRPPLGLAWLPGASVLPSLSPAGPALRLRRALALAAKNADASPPLPAAVVAPKTNAEPRVAADTEAGASGPPSAARDFSTARRPSLQAARFSCIADASSSLTMPWRCACSTGPPCPLDGCVASSPGPASSAWRTPKRDAIPSAEPATVRRSDAKSAVQAATRSSAAALSSRKSDSSS